MLGGCCRWSGIVELWVYKSKDELRNGMLGVLLLLEFSLQETCRAFCPLLWALRFVSPR